ADCRRYTILASSKRDKFIESIEGVTKFLLLNPKFLQQSLDLLMTDDGSLLSGDNGVNLRERVRWILILYSESRVVVGLSGINELWVMIMHVMAEWVSYLIR